MTTESTINLCVECEDTEANVKCDECKDIYCFLCFQAQHKKGFRAQHTKVLLAVGDEEEAVDTSTGHTAAATDTVTTASSNDGEDDDDLTCDTNTDKNDPPPSPVTSIETEVNVKDPRIKNSAYIPLRLNETERSLFVLLDAAMHVSEYTDNVDVLCYRRSATRRIMKELKELLSILSGLVLTNSLHRGKKLVLNNAFNDNADWYQQVFEVGRRYKIMNPERMRDNYGKMIYMLQDSQGQEIQRFLKFSCVKPIATVHNFLSDRNALGLLCDSEFVTATQAIANTQRRSREEIEAAVTAKSAAIKSICDRYVSATLSVEDIEQCLASVADNNSYIELNCGPIDRMIELLQTFFKTDAAEAKFSLAISSGRNGSRLTHSHRTQYAYALQSLQLWKNITTNMFRLWFAAEDDLLSGSGYRLRDTGQGLNRLQRAPTTSRLIHAILSKTQSTAAGSWVGSSVIHLGDHNVCNALMFIDKYTQVSRILSPIANTIDDLDRLNTDEKLAAYFKNEFGDIVSLKKLILSDFFKHGFDGSGAENFFDAGSCIDGRLTSAWNWCSKIEKKSYYHAFLLAGFVGFNGTCWGS